MRKKREEGERERERRVAYYCYLGPDNSGCLDLEGRMGCFELLGISELIPEVSLFPHPIPHLFPLLLRGGLSGLLS